MGEQEPAPPGLLRLLCLNGQHPQNLNHRQIFLSSSTDLPNIANLGIIMPPLPAPLAQNILQTSPVSMVTTYAMSDCVRHGREKEPDESVSDLGSSDAFTCIGRGRPEWNHFLLSSRSDILGHWRRMSERILGEETSNPKQIELYTRRITLIGKGNLTAVSNLARPMPLAQDSKSDKINRSAHKSKTRLLLHSKPSPGLLRALPHCPLQPQSGNASLCHYSIDICMLGRICSDPLHNFLVSGYVIMSSEKHRTEKPNSEFSNFIPPPMSAWVLSPAVPAIFEQAQ